MTVGSLFAGIGGFDLGLERAGMEVRWQVENNDYCNRVLAKHWPDVKRYGDIWELTGDELEPVDLICGGFPCQPVSVAGKGEGGADERWLWEDMRRICSVVRPRWVLGENVPGLLSIDVGRLFGTVVQDLAEIGYRVEWDCIPACAFGAPHIRRRVFIMAHANRDGLEESRIFGLRRDFAKSRWWETEPAVGRVVDGFPGRVDRLRGLGNAVVPQVAEWVGQRIIEAETKGIMI